MTHVPRPARWWLGAPHRRDEIHALARRSAPSLALSAVTGLATGAAVAAFERIVVEVFLARLSEAPLAVVAGAPLVGLVVAALVLRTLGRGTSPATADAYLEAFHDPSVRSSGRGFAARVVGAVATLGSGASMGLEGPSIYLGSSIGAAVQRRAPRLFRDADRRTLLVAGAAAGVAAIFKAPATGAVFALEVPYQDDLARRMLLPALVSAATGYLAFVAVNGTDPLLPVVGDPAFDLRDLAGAVVLGVVAGVAARLLAAAIRRAKALAPRHDARVRAVASGGVLALLLVAARAASGRNLTFGPGYDAIDWALDPAHATWLVLAVLALRGAATVVTVAGGGVGGLFVPLVVAGALTGRAVGGAFGALDTSLFSVVGIAAFLGAGYRVPLAAVMFVAETTGRPGFVVPGLLAAVAAELMMGSSSVTSYQVAPGR
ncbi:MAG: chloride channel protein [Acidimicrobiia bacterium]